MSIEKPLNVSIESPKDARGRAWLENNKDRNGYDPEVMDYPCTVLLKAEDEHGEVRGYMPIQNAVVLESVALDARLSAMEGAETVMNLVAASISLGHEYGMRECYFLASDEVTARGAQSMGFELVPYKIFRLRINRVIKEKPDAAQDRTGL